MAHVGVYNGSVRPGQSNLLNTPLFTGSPQANFLPKMISHMITRDVKSQKALAKLRTPSTLQCHNLALYPVVLGNNGK